MWGLNSAQEFAPARNKSYRGIVSQQFVKNPEIGVDSSGEHCARHVEQRHIQCFVRLVAIAMSRYFKPLRLYVNFGLISTEI